MNKIKTWLQTDLNEEQIARLPSCLELYTDSMMNQAVVGEIEIIIGRAPIAMLPYAKKLKWLQLDSAGNEQYVKPDLLPNDCVLSNATGCFGLAISEYLICTILMLMRNMNDYIRNQLESRWQIEGPIASIYGSTFLIVGAGNLGSTFAQKVKALGATTIGIRRHAAHVPFMDEIHTMDQLPALLPKADVVVLALPSTPETRRCFHKEYYAMMKPTAIVANVGRGDVLHTEDLLQAVQHNTIKGAILDVCDVEPLPSHHPIWKEKNIIITPHISGTFQLPYTKSLFVDLIVENSEAYLTHKELKNEVDMQAGYRKYKEDGTCSL